MKSCEAIFIGGVYEYTGEILAETGASSATISRVNRTLQYGKGGYDLVFSRTEAPDGEEKA